MEESLDKKRFNIIRDSVPCDKFDILIERICNDGIKYRITVLRDGIEIASSWYHYTLQPAKWYSDYAPMSTELSEKLEKMGWNNEPIAKWHQKFI